MLQLLHPAALWTLAACALPLAIHLWRRPPRTVRLGSLRFLDLAARRPWRNLRWREWLLLAVRLALLAALALLLAGPRWHTPPPAGPRHWALLDPTAALSGDSFARWHAARQAGDELHLLAPNFPTAPDDPAPTAAAGDPDAPDLWSLLRELDADLPTGSTLTIFSPARLAALRGTRPALGHCQVAWVHTPDLAGEVPHVWVVSVAEKSLLAGRSAAQGTVFANAAPGETLVFPTAAGERWQTEFRRDAGATSARVLGRENVASDILTPWTTNPPTPARSVLILHDGEHATDAQFVAAAIRAAADSAGYPSNLQDRDITPDVDNVAISDWTFWLSTGAVPAGLAARAPRLFRYAGTELSTDATWIVAPPGDAADGVRLWKRTAIVPPTLSRVPWWRDGLGDPLLTYSRSATGELWEFYSRFDPAWTDLPRTTALPAWLRMLLFPEVATHAKVDPMHDRRLADPLEGLPSVAGGSTTIPALAPIEPPARDLHWPLWIVGALLFAAERLLGLRRSPLPPALAPVRLEPVAAAAR